MIKKLLAFLLSIVMILGLFACGKDPGDSSQESSEQSSKSQSGWVTPSSRPEKEEEKMDNYASDNAAKSSIFNMNLEGSFYDIFKAYENNWIKHAFDINPEIWEVYKDADKYDKNKVLCPWFSEFVGKLLVGTVDAYRVSGDEETGALVKDIIAHLKTIQRENGYVGPFPASYSLPYASDPWGHYFIIVGLCDWYDLTGDEEALKIAKGAAEFLYNSYYDPIKGKFYATVTDAFNVSIAHGFTLIYEKTQDMRFYEAAKQMVTKAWTFGGNWYQNALNGKEYYETTNKRWECLHSVMALGEMYRITGDEDYYKALDQIWWSLVNSDVHNNGGFTTNEIVMGDPYASGSIESCCTVAWQAFSIGYLGLSKNPYVADELERTYFNSMLGGICEGKRMAYNIDMNGGKRVGQWSQTTISGELGRGMVDLACCTCNGGRGVSAISQWGVMTDSNALYLNYFGKSAIETKTPAKNDIVISEETDYPISGNVKITLSLNKSETFDLCVRIPTWAGENTTLSVNGESVSVKAGEYAKISREWKNGDSLELNIDMTVHFLVGDKECKNLTSAYYGPILMTLDSSLYSGNLTSAKFTIGAIKAVEVSVGSDDFCMFFDVKDVNGNDVRLTNYASAGHFGSFQSWLNVEHDMMIEGTIKGETIAWNNNEEDPETMLNNFITVAENTDLSKYVKEGADALKLALQEAKQAKDSGKDLSDVISKLHKAIVGLVRDYSDRMTEKQPMEADMNIQNFTINGENISQSDKGITITTDKSNIWSLESLPAATYNQKMGLNGLEIEYMVNNYLGNQADPYVALFFTQNCGISAWGITEKSGDGYYLAIPINNNANVTAKITSMKVGENYRPIYTAAKASPQTFVGNKITVRLEQDPVSGYLIYINGELVKNSKDGLPFDMTEALQIFEDDKAYVSFAVVLGDGKDPAPVKLTLHSIKVK